MLGLRGRTHEYTTPRYFSTDGYSCEVVSLGTCCVWLRRRGFAGRFLQRRGVVYNERSRPTSPHAIEIVLSRVPATDVVFELQRPSWGCCTSCWSCVVVLVEQHRFSEYRVIYVRAVCRTKDTPTQRVHLDKKHVLGGTILNEYRGCASG